MDVAPDSSQPPPPLPQRCAAHPEADSCAVCERCGAFLCEACRRTVDEKILCAACEERRSNRPPSREATVALILAALGPVGILPGLVGGFLGWRELKRIRDGASPASGEGWARLAQALGALYAVALVAVLLWALARMVAE
jgi:hypothetical protein